MNDNVIVLHGDCLDVLRLMPTGLTVDAIVTDPPYALGFMGQKWDTHTPGGFQHWCEEWAHECLRILKPGGHLLAFGGTRTYHRLVSGIEDAGFEIRDSIHWIHGQGFPKGKAQLKPAHEPIVVARKAGPLWLNIDACRIEGKWTTWRRNDGTINPDLGGSSPAPMDRDRGQGRTRERNPEHPAGRWPANVVLDEDAAAEMDQQSGTLKSGVVRNGGRRAGGNGVTHGVMGPSPEPRGFGDSGGASRFFPVFRYQAKAPTKERPSYVTDDGRKIAHPTCKPVALMRWLVKLVTPPGGLVLDPFAGSGATAEAAVLEGFRAVLIERESDYLPLIQQRLDRSA